MDVAGLSKMCVPLLRTFEERERLTVRGDFLHRPKQTILNLVMGLGFLAHGYASGEFEVTDERLGVYLPTVCPHGLDRYPWSGGASLTFAVSLRRSRSISTIPK